MKNYEVYYRRVGCPNANIYCKVIEAPTFELAEMEAYIEISENYTILNIIEV